MKACYYIFLTFFYPIVRLICPCRLLGRENIPSDGPLVICANHSSLMDPIMIAVHLGYRRQIYFMAKRELFQIPVVGWILRGVGAFPVQREGTDIKAIRTAMTHLKNGDRIMLFPEGTRVSDSDAVAAKTGAVRIASKLKTPILPVWLTSGNKFFKQTRIVVGKPFVQAPPADRNFEALSDELMESIYLLESKS